MAAVRGGDDVERRVALLHRRLAHKLAANFARGDQVINRSIKYFTHERSYDRLSA